MRYVLRLENENGKIITFTCDKDKQVKIELSKQNAIIKYENNYVTEIDYDFLGDNLTLKEGYVTDLLVENKEIKGVVFENEEDGIIRFDSFDAGKLRKETGAAYRCCQFQ